MSNVLSCNRPDKIHGFVGLHLLTETYDLHPHEVDPFLLYEPRPLVRDIVSEIPAAFLDPASMIPADMLPHGQNRHSQWEI